LKNLLSVYPNPALSYRSNIQKKNFVCAIGIYSLQTILVAVFSGRGKANEDSDMQINNPKRTIQHARQLEH
jgi:hypothetical protein